MTKSEQPGLCSILNADTVQLNFSTSRKSENFLGMPFEYYYAYVLMLVQLYVPRSIVPLRELNEVIQDLVQISISEFWLRCISGKVKIESPKAYLSSIVRSRCVDIARYYKKLQSTSPLDQDGEIYEGRAFISSREGERDPALEFGYRELIEKVIVDVVRLPIQQRYAMICVLKDEIGNSFPLTDTFGKHGIDIEAINWPQKAVELQRLRSSLSLARKKLRSFKK